MLRPRIFPVLLIDNSSLVKTIQFTTPKYLGDPINAVRIFNEYEVDELCIYDISIDNSINWKLLESIANECQMPVTYGGNVRSVVDAIKLVELGFEKVSVSTTIIEKPHIIEEFCKEIGSQSIVLTLDVKLVNDEYKVFTKNGKSEIGGFAGVVKILDDIGIGEVIINSIDRDGMSQGVDVELLRLSFNNRSGPTSIVGGLNSVDEICTLVEEFGPIGIGGGSFFVYKGKFRAVLPNYLSHRDQSEIYKSIIRYYENKG